MKVLILLTLATLALAAIPKPVAKPAIQLRRNSLHRITNGRDALPGEFPYQLSYQWGEFGQNQHVCGASILSPTHALTAGHCILLVPTEGDHTAIAGINQLNSAASGQTVNAVTRVVHPDYNPPDSGVAPNDLAVLGFDQPLVFGELVQPVPLTLGGLEPSGNVVLSGWGYTSTTGGTVTPNNLQTIELTLLSNTECIADIDELSGPADDPFVPGANICTGPVDEAKSACGGDSGGPLVQDGRQVGIVSWGYTPCGFPGAPSVFTNVANYLDFINQEAQLS